MNKLDIYDALDEYALKCIIWNYNKNKIIGFYNCELPKEEYKWLLSIAKIFNNVFGKDVYYKGKILDWLIYKFIYGFKYLKYTSKLADKKLIDAKVFCKEMIDLYDSSINDLIDDYNTNYKRR